MLECQIMKATQIAKCVLVAGMLAAADANAATVTLAEAQEISALWQKAHQLGSDIAEISVSVSQGAGASAPNLSARENVENLNTISCFSDLSRVVAHIEAFLSDVAIASMIDSNMKDQRDDASALAVLNATLAKYSSVLQNMRSMTNNVAGACGTNAAVNVKAQATLDFISEIDRQISPLAHTIAAHSSQ